MLKMNHIVISFKKDIIIDSHMQAKRGALTGLIGESGSGKSSLLDIMSLFRYEKQFDYFIDDINLKEASLETLQELQRTKIAYLRQISQFLNTMNCLDNIIIECEIAGKSINEKEALNILKIVDLDKKAKTYPSKLSGGEKQRLAIAMAIAKDADIIICDEITSALDDVNTQKIINLLIALAHENGKTVILSSHERNVIDQCDDIYEISDKTIHLVKQTATEKEVINSKENQKTKKFYFKTVASRLKKKKIAFIGLMMISAIAVATLNYAYHWVNQSKLYWNRTMSLVSTNEINISNTGSLHPNGLYDELAVPFEKDVVTKLQQHPEIEKIYPFYGGSLLLRGQGKSDLVWSIDDKEIGEYTVQISNTHLHGSLEEVFPYYPEQRLYEICDIKTNEKNGIYIDYTSAKDMGLLELEDNMTLSFEYYPIAALEDNTMDNYTFNIQKNDYEYAGTFPCVNRYYGKKVTVKLPISGILPEGYQDVGSYDSTATILIPYELFQEHQQIASSDYEFKDGQYPLKNSCFRIFLKSSMNRDEVKREILAMSDSLTLNDDFENYKAINESIKDDQHYLTFSFSILFVITLILLYIYSIFHRKDALDDYFFFHIRGVSAKELKQITILELITIWMMVFIVSLIFVNIIITHGIGDYILRRNDFTSIRYSSFILWDFIISGIVSLMSEFSLLIKR